MSLLGIRGTQQVVWKLVKPCYLPLTSKILFDATSSTAALTGLQADTSLPDVPAGRAESAGLVRHCH